MLERMWAIVLAGGEGSRLRALARDKEGRPAPKQFCALGGARTPLAAALERAEALVPPAQVVVSVVEAHRPWWSAQLHGRDPGTVVPQPLARGTATGILLPLLRILARDPEARVLVLPADHAVEEEETLRLALRRAAWVAERRSDEVILLGVTPTRADSELGWVVPAAAGDPDSHRVATFVEKPGPERARQLMAAGAMWNAFLLAASGATLLGLYRRHLPELVMPLTARDQAWDPALEVPPPGVFESLPSRDFSHDLLTRAALHLRVVRVPPCGWTDLGTPARLEEWLAAQGGSDAARVSVPG